MIKKLTKHGNSSALIIDRAVLELLEIDPEKTPLRVFTDGDSLVITPVRGKAHRKKFLAALDKVNRKYGPMLKRLAE